MRNEEVKNRSEEEISKEALCEDVPLEQVNGGMNVRTDPRSIKEELESQGIDVSYQNIQRPNNNRSGSTDHTGTPPQKPQQLNYLKNNWAY